MINNELKSRLAKVYELVKRGGTEGEKAAAKNALDRMLEKYNLSGMDMDSLDKGVYRFKYASDLDHWLVLRIVTMFVSDPSVIDSARRSTRGVKEIVLQLTYLDFITVSASYGYFKRHMKAQWDKTCAPELARCRKIKTRNARRKELQHHFFNAYLIASKLYKDGELTSVPMSDMAEKKRRDRLKMREVEGGQYKKQVVGGLFLES